MLVSDVLTPSSACLASCRKYFLCSWERLLRVAPGSCFRHASIDPAVRALRGLPEDLIRLCVGIEDPADLLDDLEHALLEAGAITLEREVDGHHYARAAIKRDDTVISRAVEKLAFNENAVSGDNKRAKENREWFVSAPGKAILFGEHAVVHGVVGVSIYSFRILTSAHVHRTFRRL